jgi:hypothetical protein
MHINIIVDMIDGWMTNIMIRLPSGYHQLIISTILNLPC